MHNTFFLGLKIAPKSRTSSIAAFRESHDTTLIRLENRGLSELGVFPEGDPQIDLEKLLADPFPPLPECLDSLTDRHFSVEVDCGLAYLAAELESLGGAR